MTPREIDSQCDQMKTKLTYLNRRILEIQEAHLAHVNTENPFYVCNGVVYDTHQLLRNTIAQRVSTSEFDNLDIAGVISFKPISATISCRTAFLASSCDWNFEVIFALLCHMLILTWAGPVLAHNHISCREPYYLLTDSSPIVGVEYLE